MTQQASAMRYKQISELFDVTTKLRNSAWSFGILLWLLMITNGGVTSFADGYLSATELSHLVIASCLFVGWLYLKPENSASRGSISSPLQGHQLDSSSYQDNGYHCAVQARMLELQEQHLISQEYVLPFPYLCQLHHLLDLKHLEDVHDFSLNNLKVIKVNYFQPTAMGGMIKF